MKEAPEQTTELLDLPEEVIRAIFKYLEDETLYVKVRRTCQKLNTYVENFVELGM